MLVYYMYNISSSFILYLDYYLNYVSGVERYSLAGREVLLCCTLPCTPLKQYSLPYRAFSFSIHSSIIA